ncbi:3'(2'),5'-bisphosphate nucleotidase CysQ [Nocardioides sp. CPCC 205120]|uniref:3'(2'),5'-bisphosphate nucleotidase CysQ n=1 Tax=Nocardioides sp. CPCC 205120 TaxID=3406462 RepID=UPI003B50F7F7
MPGTDLSSYDDHALAAHLATVAGEQLLDLRVRGVAESWEPSQLKDTGDRVAHELIVGLLAGARPGDAVLSEEGRDDLVRLESERVWIVDPLDGTREYGEPPREDWAVHVALWERDPADPAGGGDLTVGAVAQPALEETFSTAAPRMSPPAAGGRRPRLVVSRSRPPAVTDVVAAALDADLLPMGSAGAKVMAVVRGVADAYVHAGGQYEWDSAAPVAVARAAGLHTSRIDGSALRYNQADVYLPDLVVCRPELADRVLTALAGA